MCAEDRQVSHESERLPCRWGTGVEEPIWKAEGPDARQREGAVTKASASLPRSGSCYLSFPVMLPWR